MQHEPQHPEPKRSPRTSPSDDPVLEQRLMYARNTVRGSREQPLSALLATEQHEWKARTRAVEKTDAQLESVLDVWAKIMPMELCQLCRPAKLAKGTLVVYCPDASARHTLDRHLRSGALGTLRAKLPEVRTVRPVVKVPGAR